ncbi:MAG: hypothetical protein M1829_003351 [Trizodia sp. TS-e1964]|nr:MAG: hypothetical protein M1829_003351 [Trizodia sp. TS-e1964]
MSDHSTKEDVADPNHIENAEPARKPPGFLARVKAHFRKWWWLHLIIFISVTLLLVLLLIYVAYPKIAQKGVDDSTLVVTALSFLNPTSTSVFVHQDSLLQSSSAYHPQLDAMNVSLFLENTEPNIIPFAYLQLPTVVSTDSTPIILDQNVSIANLDQFTAYATLILSSEEFRIGIRGRTDLHEGRYPTIAVDYNEAVTFKGLNSLLGFNVTSPQILLIAASDGANLLAKAYIPNPSIMTIALGNITLDLYVTGDFIGTAVIPDLLLKPGDNTVDLRAKTNQSMVLRKLSTTFKDGKLPVDIKVNSSIYDGQHLTYYESALKTRDQHVVVDLSKALG